MRLSRSTGIADFGRLLARLPHEEALRRAERAASSPPSEPDALPTPEERLALFASARSPRLRRTPVPPSFATPYGYDRHGTTHIEFTDMHGWPGEITTPGHIGEEQQAAAVRRALGRNLTT
ncbi:hypothetical protein [Marinactinospora rubrisoli]|uniref:Uncharacterized protein n=1 Tax=Marinactinospora rubrisoli TaxID=2715399 RepID=A0ABW2KIT0_9ACTN